MANRMRPAASRWVRGLTGPILLRAPDLFPILEIRAARNNDWPGQVAHPFAVRGPLVAKLVAMGIDSGAIPWNQWTPAARKCLKRSISRRHVRRALALIIRWS